MVAEAGGQNGEGRGYHHGSLREAIVASGAELARAGGPGAVLLRAASRPSSIDNRTERVLAGQLLFGHLGGVSGLVTGAVFKTVVRRVPSQGGSIPLRLRHMTSDLRFRRRILFARESEQRPLCVRSVGLVPLTCH